MTSFMSYFPPSPEPPCTPALGVIPTAAEAICLYPACVGASIHMYDMILPILIACIYTALIQLANLTVLSQLIHIVIY